MDGKLLLRIAGGATLGFGLLAIFFPSFMVDYADFNTTAAQSYSEIRAIFGGLFIVLGAAVLAGPGSPARKARIKLVGMVFLGCIAGRVIGMIFDGPFHLTPWVGLLLEGAAAWCIFAGLRRVERPVAVIKAKVDSPAP
ncbi:MAG: DUF4345 domain-containing protein [Planctomycetota bacterium]|nr:MAG: DUF4345 domain-containing protein [Planctomycetota bacterium]